MTLKHRVANKSDHIRSAYSRYRNWSKHKAYRRALFVLINIPYFVFLTLYEMGAVVCTVVEECYRYIRYGV